MTTACLDEKKTGKTFAEIMSEGNFLIVDDFDSMRKITAALLRQLGAINVFEASNGEVALRILESKPITAILSDWNMPVMNGLDFLIAVRNHPKHRKLPFLMLTAEADRERVSKAIAAGVSELLVKPYTSAKLASRLEQALTTSFRFTRPASSPVMPSPVLPASVSAENGKERSGGASEKPTILIVDDTPDNLILLAGMFKQEYRVKVADNGPKALKLCQCDNPPDLILLDVMMPGMDGFEVAAKLREHPSSEQIPVIFVTAMTDESARTKGMGLGAVDFVTKPINPDSLNVKVRNFMRYVALHRQLQADYDNMMEASRLREDVEQITRHDLKGPIAGALGLIQSLIESGELSPAHVEQLRLVEEANLQALNMVNLSAEIYKIETGRYELKPRTISLVPVLRRVIELTRKAKSDNNQLIELILPDGLADTNLLAVGEEMFCYSLFQNLLKNASEAAPDGSKVTVSVFEGNPRKVTIANSGVVPVDIRGSFFDKFSTASKQGGTGLGTYSAKLLVEAQNGSISMETSDEANSTQITVLLPALDRIG